MIWVVAIRDGGNRRVERCETCMCRAHRAVRHKAELQGPRAHFERALMMMIALKSIDGVRGGMTKVATECSHSAHGF